MVQTFHVVRCYSCLTFQSHQVRKDKKFVCKICGAKQSVKKTYGEGSGKDCRIHVQKLNSVRRDLEAEQQRRLDNQLEEEEEQDLPIWTADDLTPVLLDAKHHEGVHEGTNNPVTTITSGNFGSKWLSFLPSDSEDSNEDNSASSTSTQRHQRNQEGKLPSKRRQATQDTTTERVPLQHKSHMEPTAIRQFATQKSQFTSSHSRLPKLRTHADLSSGEFCGSVNEGPSVGEYLVHDWSDVWKLNDNNLERETNTFCNVRKNYPPSPSKKIKLPCVKYNLQSRKDGSKCDRQKYTVQPELTHGVNYISKSFAEDSTLPSSSHKMDHFSYGRENMPIKYSALSCKYTEKTNVQNCNNSKFQNKRNPSEKNNMISTRNHEIHNKRVCLKESDQINSEAFERHHKKLCMRHDTSFDSELSTMSLEKPKPVLQISALNQKQNQNRQIGKITYADGKLNVDAVYIKFAAAENIDDIYDLDIWD